MSIRFDDQVVVITGAGAGLGRSHALAFAARGAKVVVNDFGGARDGTGNANSAAALAVVEEIRQAGGSAIANGANVADYAQVQELVKQTLSAFGRIDVLVNNAGILRDKSFSKLEQDDFKAVLDVHLMGSINCTKAVWDIMREQQYGRIVMTTSGAGLYGNFGQANYAAAKMALVGLMNVLSIEGRKHNIQVNTIAPAAATRMTEDLLAPHMLEQLKPEAVTPAVIYLCSANAPTRTLVAAGAGAFSAAAMVETAPVRFDAGQLSPEAIAERFDEIADWSTAQVYRDAGMQIQRLLGL